MGVVQVGSGRIDVAVLEWSEDGESDVLIEARLDDGGEGWKNVLMLTEIYSVRRGLIDPMPEVALARAVCKSAPLVFALHAARGRSAIALAEIAHSRMQTMGRGEPDASGAARVVDVGRGEGGEVTVAVYVPPGEPVPTRIEFVLGDAVVMGQPSGGRMIEATASLADIRVVGEPDATPVP